MELIREKQEILDLIVNDLKNIEQIVAVVLGGSYATGQATEDSDLDIGIYYSEANPFDIERIKTVAQKYSTGATPTVTDFYQWGPWVNGGAWINTASGKVDFLYRNIEQVKAVIEKAKNGQWENHFEQQPPYGFSSVIYLAEIKSCIPLHDPGGVIENLKTEVQFYPDKLKQTIVQDSLWSAEFTILHADTFTEKKDIYNAMGCLTRALKNIVAALFAINELYPIGDKRAIDILENAGKIPSDLRERIERILYTSEANLTQSTTHLKSLFEETVAFTNGMYQPLYKFKNA